jgi:hypothetical protein
VDQNRASWNPTGLLELRELRLRTVDTDVQVANLACFFGLTKKDAVREAPAGPVTRIAID